MHNKRDIIATALAATLASGALMSFSLPARAEGSIGGVLERGCDGCLGGALDQAHQQFKRAKPGYGKAEEKLTNDLRREIGPPLHSDLIYNNIG